MPQFIMPKGDAVSEFNELDSFTQGYVEALFFTECHSDNPELEEATFADLAPETLAMVIRDCQDFRSSLPRDNEGRTWLDLAYESPNGYSDNQAGVDFWLTRNRHGCGFWDRGLGQLGESLAWAAHGWGEVYVCRGDDGLIYV